MDRAALFTATAIASVAGTLFMALIPNLPIAQAPGMGLNSFFAFSVVLGLGYSWQMALTAVFIEGIIFLVLTACNIREMIVNTIPKSIKDAIPVGIGLFIALIGMQNAGLIVKNPNTMVSMGSMSDPHIWVALLGLAVTAVLFIKNVHGSFLIGIIASTIFAVFLGLVKLPEEGIFSLPPDISPVFMSFEWKHLFSLDMLIVVFTFLFVNLFDTIGTLLGVASKATYWMKKAISLRLKKPCLPMLWELP
ncbi:xanthine/uracil/thiamine/ascorbate permease family protein [Bacteroides pyogenes DSM 20611 = JCM 6294]|uniref:Xanthine/uracil/thiamine/ascorbate permease family protein n=1 Tax=Bacteroides pyogenes DSM 20611 = JCM 6294 TaxID=1121100 RepID=W4PIU4_9BACE|nr:xanthine/uracil/thiamine/ascorbate permease family protein [Bacteroides pyogenes DSM 20611 = JCM 6294]